MEEQAQRDEEAVTCRRLRAHQKLVERKTERQTPINHETTGRSRLKTYKEAKSGEPNKSAEKAKAASGEGKSNPTRAVKKTIVTVTEENQGRNAKGKRQQRWSRPQQYTIATTIAYAAVKGKNSNLGKPTRLQAPTRPVVHEVLVPEAITVADLAQNCR